LVIRLRKSIIYGQPEVFDTISLHEDYAGVGLYYRQANACWPGICPPTYAYHLDPDLTFTLESYMGPALSFERMSIQQGFVYGRQVGTFFRTMHDRPAPIKGFGDIVWNGETLVARQATPLESRWADEVTSLHEHLDRLRHSDHRFDHQAVKASLDQALVCRNLALEPVTLVNGDITQENLIVRRGSFAGLIDPVPLLHNGLRYAAFFIYCYKSYLPNLYDAPRYARHHYQQHQPLMTAIADGYQAGYTHYEPGLIEALRQEYFLWALTVAAENLARLTATPTPESYLRAGDRQAIAARLQRCLRELEALCQPDN
ncbi:MAG: hypothetical protein R3264_23540, partial [Anaerolineae bacterium]|nr:hypothetical protein [Anaerolineae bacterium]